MVSIPFIAGQWSLRTPCWPRASPAAFQSPSLRGSGRFRAVPMNKKPNKNNVSIPFIAGQWSLRAGKGD